MCSHGDCRVVDHAEEASVSRAPWLEDVMAGGNVVNGGDSQDRRERHVECEVMYGQLGGFWAVQWKENRWLVCLMQSRSSSEEG